MGGANMSEEFLKSMVDSISATAASVAGASGLASPDGSTDIINLFTCAPGSECYKTKHNTYLKNVFLQAKEKYDAAPIDLSRAEKNYTVSNEGSAAYDTLISTRLTSTVDEFRQNSIDRQQQFVADLTQALKQYHAQAVFQAQAASLLSLRANEQRDLIKQINYYQKNLHTNERRVVLENKNMDSLYGYRRSMLFLYYAGIIGFIIFGNFIPEKLYLRYSVWLLIIIAAIIPVILNITIMWIFLFADTLAYWWADLPHKDVYKDMGNVEGPPQATPKSLPAAAGTSEATPEETAAVKAMAIIPGMPTLPPGVMAALGRTPPD